MSFKPTWKDVAGYEGVFEVSDAGEVRRIGSSSNMSKTDDGHGYLAVHLSTEGKAKFLRVHRLVAIAYIPNPDNFPMVLHNPDNDKTNNYAFNLKWGTHQDNMDDRRASGDNPVGIRNGGGVKLTDDKVMEIKKLLTEGNKTQVEIAKGYGVSNALITRIKLGQNWSHVEVGNE